MKKILLVLFFSFFLALPTFAQEKIDSFDVNIQVNQDATINVSEKIQYNFGVEERHGIYRDIPIKYNRNGNNFNLRISDISITDEKDHPYNYEISYYGDNMDLKIGDADILITGVKTYIINYKINRAINYFDDHDELYWNVTGNEWPVAIEKSSATITLPQNVPLPQLQDKCYSGPYGSTASCTAKKYSTPTEESLMDFKVNKITFSQGLLNSYEGLTVVFGWPVGIVHEPTTEENLRYFIEDNKGIFIFPGILLLCLIYWFLFGKDPSGRGTIIAEYEAPKGLSPAEVGTIIDEKTQKKDISAEIINLAVKGCLKIKRNAHGTYFKHPNYSLIKLKEPAINDPEHEKKLMAALFDGKTEVKLNDLHEDFYDDYQQITKDIYTLTATKGYFPKNPPKMRTRFLILGIITTVLLYGIFDALTTTVGQISCTVAIIIVIIASRFMSKRTKKGVLAKEKILGLKEYLTVAEKDRIKFFNAPAKNPELFEKLLPYAMVLGVEKEWAGQFADIYKQPPKWYNTNEDLSTFNSMSLVSGMQNFSSQAGTILYTAPASASSGSSGFSSGGGSGGGFGGGGGGSW